MASSGFVHLPQQRSGPPNLTGLPELVPQLEQYIVMRVQKYETKLPRWTMEALNEMPIPRNPYQTLLEFDFPVGHVSTLAHPDFHVHLLESMRHRVLRLAGM